jgi:3-mercaptopyruvate sulfurtransferase SseA
LDLFLFLPIDYSLTVRNCLDTREPAELQSTGTIPDALNIPITTHPNAFLLPEEEFSHRFGFPKPDPRGDSVMVMFCRAGVRAASAAALAKDAGYKKVIVYPGSWLDWSKRNGQTERDEPQGEVWRGS